MKKTTAILFICLLTFSYAGSQEHDYSNRSFARLSYITGNTFNVRNDSDIKKIAQELYSLSHKGQRAAGVLT